MPSEFEKKIDSVTALRAVRYEYTREILQNQPLFPELLELCFQFSNENAPKAFWILELVCYEKLEWLVPYLDYYCLNIKQLKNDSSIRPASKICLVLAVSHFKKKEIILSEIQLQQLTETCFDWLIKNTKVASKCYCIRALHLLGNHFNWIHPELKIILDKEYKNHSAAYKAVGREILKKINKPK